MKSPIGLLKARRAAPRGTPHPIRGLALIGALLMAIMIAGTAALVLDRRAADIAAAQHEADSLSVAIAEQTSLTFGGVDFVLQDLLKRIAAAGAASPEMLAASMGTPEVHRLLANEVAGLGQADVAGIVGADGRLINNSALWPIPDLALGDRDYFLALRDDPALPYFVGARTDGRTTGEATIPLARRIDAPDGRFLGVVVARLRLSYFDRLYRAVSEGDGRGVALQRRDGNVLARYPETGRTLDAGPASDATVLDTQSGARASRGLARSPVTGEIVLHAAEAVRDLPLVVVVERTETSILASWRRQTTATCAGLAVAVATLIAGLIVLARQIVRRAASEAALAATLDHMSQGIQMIDRNGRVQVYNRRALEMLDLPNELMASKPSLEDVLRYLWDHGEFVDKNAGLNKAVRKLLVSDGMDGVPRTYERQRPDGTFLEIVSIPLPGGGVVRTFADVTMARTREAALRAALAARDDAEKALLQHGQDLEEELAARTRPLAASEARHRDMAEFSSDWIWEIDVAQCLTFVSKRFGDTSGIPWALVTGLPLRGLVDLGFDPAAMRNLCATIDARFGFLDAINRVDLKSGETRFWVLSGKPFTDAATGAYAGYRGTGTDVTEKTAREAKLNAALLRTEAAERAANRATTRLMEAIEAIPEGFVLHDADDRLVLCNSRYAEYYRLGAAERAAGVLFADALRATALRSGSIAAIANVEPRLARHRAHAGNREDQQLPNGRWLQVVESRTSDGGTVGIRIDVTEARQREAAERDHEKLAALGHLAGGVAHEINNLLQPALALADLVRESIPPGNADAHEALDCVLDSTRQMREIVRNILLFARKEEPRLVPLDLVTELRAALAFVGHLMPSLVTIRESGLDDCIGCIVAANKTQLIQVLTNLLVNAAQATTGSGTVTVSVARSEPDPDEAEQLAIAPGRPYLALSVADTGSGMDAATQARIFEPFFTTKPIGQGTGLGLSVAYGILRSWNGAIAVRSAVGQGTTFVLYVPLANAADG